MTQAVDQALIKAIVEGGLAIDIVHENGIYSEWGGSSYTHVDEPYAPQAGREFCEIRNFPALRTAQSLAHSDIETGILQIIFKYPSDTGAFDVKEKAEEAMDLFVIGESISYIDGSIDQDVYTESKTRDGGRNEGGYYQIVVRINYYAFVAR